MMFYGEKLKQLRELNGFSRRDLGNKLEVSEQAIGQYENDQATPRLDVLNKLPALFKVTSNFFNSPSFVKENVITEGAIAYRTKDRSSQKKITDELEYISYAKFFIDYFDSFVTSNIGGFNELMKRVINFTNSNIDLRIEKIAEVAKNFLSLTDNRLLMSKLEQSGITILEKDLGLRVDAYSGFTKDGEPYIVLGNIKKTAVRRNFDLAHELGHLLLHSYIIMTDLTDKEHTVIENQANLFASAFLLPRSEFICDFRKISHNTNPDSYIDLKKKYLVSIAALEYRAYKLHLLSYQQNRYFWSQMTKKQYRVFEPLDDKIVPVKPGKLRSLLSFLLENKLITIDSISKRFGITKEFLINLFDLKSDFFDKYAKTKSEIKSKSNLIDLNSVRKQLGY